MRLAVTPQLSWNHFGKAIHERLLKLSWKQMHKLCKRTSFLAYIVFYFTSEQRRKTEKVSLRFLFSPTKRCWVFQFLVWVNKIQWKYSSPTKHCQTVVLTSPCAGGKCVRFYRSRCWYRSGFHLSSGSYQDLTSVFFNLFPAPERSSNVCAAHWTLWHRVP